MKNTYKPFLLFMLAIMVMLSFRLNTTAQTTSSTPLIDTPSSQEIAEAEAKQQEAEAKLKQNPSYTPTATERTNEAQAQSSPQPSDAQLSAEDDVVLTQIIKWS